MSGGSWKDVLKKIKKDLKKAPQRKGRQIKSGKKNLNQKVKGMEHSLKHKKIEENDDEIFEQAMRDVVPLSDTKGYVLRQTKEEDEVLIDRELREEIEVMTKIEMLVRGQESFNFVDSNEYIEASVKSLDPRIMKRLKRGEYYVERRIDLHGLTSKEAKVVVKEFIRDCYLNGNRVVLIVHGRGLHSKNQIPVIKEELKKWLTRSSIAKYILGFTSAAPGDGGVGAIYLLLRRSKNHKDKPILRRS